MIPFIPFKQGQSPESGRETNQNPIPKPSYSSASESDDDDAGWKTAGEDQRPPKYDDFEVEEVVDEPDTKQPTSDPTTKAHIAQGHIQETIEKDFPATTSTDHNEAAQPAKRKIIGPDHPAYVAPIGEFGKIPPIERIHAEPDADEAHRMSIHDIDKKHLVGKTIDEYGHIVDEDTGKVLGRVAGDLPSMVGRVVSNEAGDVLDDDGELLGYVAEVEQKPGPGAGTMGMDDFMSAPRGPGGLRVDQHGNILGPEGNIVGSFYDKIAGFGKPAPPSLSGGDQQKAEEEPRPPRPSAQSHRKEAKGESPSDIFLDVKSTHEGIQLTIRIPTVFPAGGSVGQPQVVFSGSGGLSM